MNYLKKNDLALTDWRYSVEIKVLMVMGSFKKSTKIRANINLLQAAVIKHDIDLVKFITSLALKKSQFNLDNLLKEVMMCDIPQKWKEWESKSGSVPGGMRDTHTMGHGTLLLAGTFINVFFFIPGISAQL